MTLAIDTFPQVLDIQAGGGRRNDITYLPQVRPKR
jgi:hypothetical protein